MKLKYATKLFICVNVLTVAFRTLQIIFMTESGTQFLKDSFKVISIIGTVVSVLALALLLPRHFGNSCVSAVGNTLPCKRNTRHNGTAVRLADNSHFIAVSHRGLRINGSLSRNRACISQGYRYSLFSVLAGGIGAVVFKLYRACIACPHRL